jgi:predicted phage terminase large subunit-like protein
MPNCKPFGTPLTSDEEKLNNADGKLTPVEKERQIARESLLTFTQFTKPNYRVNWHHRTLAAMLDRVATGACRRLMVFLPPQHGKSELVSRRFPAYMLGRNPELRLIAASHTHELAVALNRDVQRILDNDKYQGLFPDVHLATPRSPRGLFLPRRTMGLFELVNHRGGLRSAGVGQSIAGMPADGAIIDDPFGKREDADSAAMRQRVWDWYANDLYTRLSATAWIVLTHTRWHRDDLAGRLLKKMADRAADQWEILCLPAIRTDAVGWTSGSVPASKPDGAPACGSARDGTLKPDGAPACGSARDGASKPDAQARDSASKPDGASACGSAGDGTLKPDAQARDSASKPDAQARDSASKPDGASACGSAGDGTLKPDAQARDGASKPDAQARDGASKPDGASACGSAGDGASISLASASGFNPTGPQPETPQDGTGRSPFPTDPRLPGEALWPEFKSRADLEIIRQQDARAFAALYQQDPAEATLSDWPPELFGPEIWCPREQWPREFRLSVVCLDASKGQSDRPGDYSAIVFMGIAENRMLYVDAIIDRIPLNQVVRRTLAFCDQYRPDLVGIEAEQFQELLVHEFNRQCREGFAKRWSVFTMRSQGINKVARIRRLTQYIAGREFRFRAESPDCRRLVDQLMDFPLAEHDDGPDALEMCTRLPLEVERLR